MKIKNCLLLLISVSVSQVFAQIDTSAFKLFMKLTGHKKGVEAVAFSQNGKFMASGGYDYDMHIYKADTPGFAAEKYVLKGHMGGITSIAFSKDGKYVASASKDFTVRLYGLEKGDLVFSASDHRAEATRVLIDPKSKYVMSSSLDGTLMMYEFMNVKAKPKMIKYSGPISSFVTAVDGRSLYIAGEKSDIDNIDFKAAVLRSLKGHTGKVNCLELSPNGKMMASGSDDKTVIIWDVATGKVLKTLKGHTWKVTSVAWSIDGNYLTSTCNDGQTKVWELATGNCLKTLSAMGKNARTAVWSPDMGYILVATLMDATNNGAVIYKTPLQKMPAPASGKQPAKPAGQTGTTGTQGAKGGSKPATGGAGKTNTGTGTGKK